MMGTSLRPEKSTLDQVRARLEQAKLKKLGLASFSPTVTVTPPQQLKDNLNKEDKEKNETSKASDQK